MVSQVLCIVLACGELRGLGFLFGLLLLATTASAFALPLLFTAVFLRVLAFVFVCLFVLVCAVVFAFVCMFVFVSLTSLFSCSFGVASRAAAAPAARQLVSQARRGGERGELREEKCNCEVPEGLGDETGQRSEKNAEMR